MRLEDMTREQLVENLVKLRERLTEMKSLEVRHRQVEESLKESQRRYNLVAENVSDVIWTMDMNLQYTYISPSVTRVRGYSAEEAMKQKLEDIFIQSSCEEIRRVFEEELGRRESEKTQSYRARTLEVQVKCRDGSTSWAEVKAAFLPGEKGGPAGVLGITRDIDRRKRAEKEKNALLRRQQALLENVPAFIFLKDSEMRYTAVNRAYFDLLPEGIDDPIGKRDGDFFPRGLASRFEAEDRDVLENGRTLKKEEPMHLRDGRVLDMAVTITPVRAHDGSIVGMVGIAFDITERKQAEERLRRYAGELETANEKLAQLMEEVRALSLTDELSGLYNRRGFLTLAQQQMKVTNRTGRGLSLFYFDLDNMKKINDRLGHKEGDTALRDTARVLKETFRDSDIVARVGGDEFAVLAIETPEANAETFAVRLHETLITYNGRGHRPFRLSLSMGVAHYDPENPCLLDELMEKADRLMYEHKHTKKKS